MSDYMEFIASKKPPTIEAVSTVLANYPRHKTHEALLPHQRDLVHLSGDIVIQALLRLPHRVVAMVHSVG